MSKIYSIEPKKYVGINAIISHLVLASKVSPEISLVEMEANSEIKPHTHRVDAKMFILSGTAKVLSDDENNGKEVNKGDCVYFKKSIPHGFRAGAEGMTFLSVNDGICQPDGSVDFVA